MQTFSKHVMDPHVRTSESFETSKSWEKLPQTIKKPDKYTSLQPSLNDECHAGSRIVFVTPIPKDFLPTSFYQRCQIPDIQATLLCVFEVYSFIPKKYRERLFYYIIIQTYEVGLHSRRHPIEIDAGTRPSHHLMRRSLSQEEGEIGWYVYVCVCVCVRACVCGK